MEVIIRCLFVALSCRIYLASMLSLFVLGTAAIPCWNTTNLSQPRAYLAAASVGNLALFAGGLNVDGTTSSVVDIFDLNSNTWRIASLSHPRAYLAATTVGNIVLFAGGFDGVFVSSIVDIYNDTSKTWNVTNLSQPRKWVAATTVSNLAIFGGGDAGPAGQNPLSTVDIYNLTSNSWTTANLSRPCTFMVATTVGNLAIFASGTSTVANPTDQVDIYNMTSNSWTTAKLYLPANFLAATTVGNISLIAGGYNPTSGRLNVVNIYNFTSSSWSLPSALSKPRNALTAATVDNLAIFAGGIEIYPYSSNTVDIYNVTSNTWNGSNVLSQPRAYLASTSVGHFAFFAGGNTGTGPGGVPSSVVDIFSTICISCPQGTYSNTISCIPCPSGTYQNQAITSPYPTTCYSSVSLLTIILSSVFAVLGFLALILVIGFIILRLRIKRNNYHPHLSISSNKVTDIEIQERLGGGNFGEVYLAKWQGTTDVAVKKLKDGTSIQEFESEVSALQSLRHRNIVQFFGTYAPLEGSYYIVTEYMSKGSLDKLLHRSSDVTIHDMLAMARDAASGMEYLSQQKVVHRDLALRNLLVAPSDLDGIKYLVKVADFGMARFTERGYYDKENTSLPVKWSAPEAIQFGKFSLKSDCWSFGITMWELFNQGAIPYPGMGNKEVIQSVSSGYRMEPPPDCPSEIAALMRSCWSTNPSDRPTFREIYDILQNLCNRHRIATPPVTNVRDSVSITITSSVAYANTVAVQDFYMQ